MCEFLLSSHLQCIPSCSIHQILANFWDMNSTGAVSQFRKRKRKLLSCIYFTSSRKRFVRPFHFVGMLRQKELYKKHYAHAKLLFCFIIKPIASLPFSLLLLLSMLKPPIFFFPCRFQFGPKNNRTLILLLPLICSFVFSFWVFDSVIVSKYTMHMHIRTVMPVCMS